MVNKSQSTDENPSILGERLVISVKEARKLLGKNFSKLEDNQIEDLIVKLDLIAKGFIASSIST